MKRRTCRTRWKIFQSKRVKKLEIIILALALSRTNVKKFHVSIRFAIEKTPNTSRSSCENGIEKFRLILLFGRCVDVWIQYLRVYTDGTRRKYINAQEIYFSADGLDSSKEWEKPSYWKIWHRETYYRRRISTTHLEEWRWFASFENFVSIMRFRRVFPTLRHKSRLENAYANKLPKWLSLSNCSL